MSKREKTSEKLLDTLRKTKESADASAEQPPAEAAPAQTVKKPSPPSAARAARPEKKSEESVRTIMSSRRVWPD